jgi:hypothetical protein
MAEVNNNFFWIMVFLIISIIFLLTKEKINKVLGINSHSQLISSTECNSLSCPPMRRDFKLSNQGPWKFDDSMILASTDIEKNKKIQMEIMNTCYEDLENDMINYIYKPKNLFIIP